MESNSRGLPVHLRSNKFLCEQFTDFDSIPNDYHFLFEIGADISFDLNFWWFQLLTNTALLEDEKLIIYAVRDLETDINRLLLPLLRDGHSLRSLSNFYTSLYLPLISGDKKSLLLQKIFYCVRSCEARIPSLNLSPMPVDEEIYEEVFQALKDAGWKPFRYFCFGNWYFPVNGISYEEYFAGLSSRLRHTIRRKGKRFYKSGGSIRLYDDLLDLDRAVVDYESIYEKSWKKSEPFTEFMPGFINMLASKKMLRLAVAYIGEVPIAAQLWVVGHKKAAIYKLAYDEEYANYSAGTILSDYMMKHVLQFEDVEEIDYLIGDDSYKKDWMTCRRERWGIIAYNPSSIVGCWKLVNEAFKRAAKGAFSSFQKIS